MVLEEEVEVVEMLGMNILQKTVKVVMVQQEVMVEAEGVVVMATVMLAALAALAVQD